MSHSTVSVVKFALRQDIVDSVKCQTFGVSRYDIFNCRSRFIPIWLVSFALGCLWSNRSAALDDPPSFELSIAPILIARCLECHQGAEPSGGLNLTSATGLKTGGESGEVLGNTQDPGLLIEHVQSGTMPPTKNGKSQKLPAEEIDAIERWMKHGAPWPEDRRLQLYERTTQHRGGFDWWAFQSIPELLTDEISRKVPQTDPILLDIQLSSEIDRLIGESLNNAGLSPAPLASPRERLRRLYVDLTGLPPSFEQVAAFESEPTENVYRDHVEQLLRSDAFAERWTQHWLDVVRFAETNGYERDAPKPDAWRYRSWVLDAIRSDMPYDRFIVEQLAGDQLPNRDESTVIATGFLRLGAWDDEPNDPNEYQYERLEDMVHATTTAFLGLTVKCARCHDHKFDPIPQEDYYRLAASFWKGPVETRNREWNGGSTAEELEYNVLGWTDLPHKTSPFRLLIKGNAARPSDEVSPGTLTAMGTEGWTSAQIPDAYSRSKLAHWIAHPRNPLTPRVAVNRLWLKMFGEGIVRTPDNFGFTGAKPTHPALLDRLAVRLVHSGWQIKSILRGIAYSHTYQQSSHHPKQTECESIDAANQWYWRANRKRLDAESLRDSILTVSGMLDRTTGGPSFHAPIDREALEGLSMKENAYFASPTQLTNRRSLYMFKKRALAVPMMTVFDLCDNTLPVGKRDTTIVAPQALTMLNGTFVREQSRAMAETLSAADLPRIDTISKTWQRALLRSPNDTEIQSALRMLEWNSPENIPLNRLALLCHAIMNSNEFVFVD